MGGEDDKIFYDSLHTADMPHARTRYKRSVFIITTFIEQNFKIYLAIPHLILLPAQDINFLYIYVQQIILKFLSSDYIQCPSSHLHTKYTLGQYLCIIVVKFISP